MIRQEVIYLNCWWQSVWLLCEWRKYCWPVKPFYAYEFLNWKGCFIYYIIWNCIILTLSGSYGDIISHCTCSRDRKVHWVPILWKLQKTRELANERKRGKRRGGVERERGREKDRKRYGVSVFDINSPPTCRTNVYGEEKTK